MNGPNEVAHGSATIQRMEEIAGVRDRLGNLLRTRRFSSRDIFAVRLSVEEALVNAVRHGNRGDPTKSVWIQYRLAPDEVEISVEDQGAGFDPEHLPDCTAPENVSRTSGRGVKIMRGFMDRVTFNEKGTRVTMLKRRHEEIE